MPRPTPSEEQTLLTIRLPVRLKKKLEALAKKDKNRPTTAFVRNVLEDFVNGKLRESK